MYNNIVVGLDIGSNEVRGVAGYISNDNTFYILGFARVPSSSMENGSITNINKLSENIENVISNLEIQADVSINAVRIGISDCKILTENQIVSIIRNSNDNEINFKDILQLKSDIQKTLLPAGKSIIEVVNECYSVDYKKNVKDPVGMRGVRLEGEFKIFTVDSEILKSLDKAVYKIGKKIVSVTVSSLASSIVVLSKEEKDAGVCLIDFGKDSIKISIFISSVLVHFSILPIGSYLITNDLKKAFFLFANQAESLKINLSNILLSENNKDTHVEIANFNNKLSKMIPVESVSTVVKERFKEIVQQIGVEIHKFCKNKGIPISSFSAGLVLQGGGSKFLKSTDFFEKTIHLETRMAKLNQNIEVKNNSAKNFDYYDFISPIGIAVNSYKSIDSRDDFYKETNLGENYFFDKSISDKKNNTIKKAFTSWLSKTKKILIDEENE